MKEKIIAFFTLLLVPWALLANEPYTPGQDSAVRTQIRDAFRRTRPQPTVRFSVTFLLVQGDWALLHAHEGADDGEIAATLRRVAGKWTVVNSWWHEPEPYTPKEGSMVRKQICDAFRRTRPQPTAQFVVRKLLVQGNWAIIDAQGYHPQEAKFDDGEILATLRRVDGIWTEVYASFHDDFPFFGADDRGRGDISDTLREVWNRDLRQGHYIKSGPFF
jgi:hypothetical protein